MTDRRLSQAREGLKGGRTRVLSVDVFDTLLWRRVPEPADLFLVLGQELLEAGKLAPGISAVAFAQLRYAAERAAREKVQAVSGYREIRLNDIYTALPDDLFTPGFDRTAQAKAELACERRMLVADEDILSLIADAKASGAKVILVSDTYFSSSEMRDFLTAAGCGDLGFVDRLYVSCEAGRPKYRDLFDTILKDMAVTPGQMLHVGDSLEADIAACAARQIPAVHYDKWAFAPRVQDIEFPPEIEARVALLAARGDFGLTGLRARLHHRAPPGLAKGQGPFWQIGAAQLAPVFAGFARWIAGTCAAQGTSKIFGVMREGRFLGRLVEATARDLGIDLKTEELWLSRRAVMGAALFADDLSLLSDAIAVAPGETTDEIFTHIGLTVPDVARVLPGFDTRVPGAIVMLAEAIATDAALKAKVLARSAELRRNLLKGIAKHFDLNSPQRVSVMDLGYAATIQTVLARILAREGAKVRLQGLYFALNDRALHNRRNGADIRGFIDGFNTPVSRLLTRTPDVLEHACMCREGSLARYDESGTPVLLANQRDEAQLQQMETLQDGIMAGAATVNRLLGDLAATPHESATLKAQIGRIVESLLLHPTKAEVDSVGAWRHEANFDLADRRALTDLGFDPGLLEYRGLAVLADIGRHQAYWPAAALAKANPFLGDAFAAGAEDSFGAVFLTSGPLLGGVTITPDIGAGFDPRRGGTVALAVNAFGRGELKVVIKAFGADVYTRVKLTWPAAQAVIAISSPLFVCHGEHEDRALTVKTLTWSGTRDVQPSVQLSANVPAETVLELGDAPPFAHTLEMVLRFKYLRLTPLFGAP